MPWRLRGCDGRKGWERGCKMGCLLERGGGVILLKRGEGMSVGVRMCG